MIFDYDKERELLREHGMIVVTGHVDSIMAKQVTQDIILMAIAEHNEITVVMNSPGGEAESGLGIVDAIRYAQDNGIKVTGKVYGHAMSMMLDILQACDNRICGKYSWLMVHGLRSQSEADMKGTEAYVDFMKGMTHQAAELYADRNTSNDTTYKNSDFWYDLMKTDHPNFLSADLGLEMGLIDSIE